MRFCQLTSLRNLNLESCICLLTGVMYTVAYIMHCTCKTKLVSVASIDQWRARLKTRVPTDGMWSNIA